MDVQRVRAEDWHFHESNVKVVVHVGDQAQETSCVSPEHGNWSERFSFFILDDRQLLKFDLVYCGMRQHRSVGSWCKPLMGNAGLFCLFCFLGADRDT